MNQEKRDGQAALEQDREEGATIRPSDRSFTGWWLAIAVLVSLGALIAAFRRPGARQERQRCRLARSGPGARSHAAAHRDIER